MENQLGTHSLFPRTMLREYQVSYNVIFVLLILGTSFSEPEWDSLYQSVSPGFEAFGEACEKLKTHFHEIGERNFLGFGLTLLKRYSPHSTLTLSAPTSRLFAQLFYIYTDGAMRKVWLTLIRLYTYKQGVKLNL